MYCEAILIRLTSLFSPCTNKANHSNNEANKEDDGDDSKCNEYV